MCQQTCHNILSQHNKKKCKANKAPVCCRNVINVSDLSKKDLDLLTDVLTESHSVLLLAQHHFDSVAINTINSLYKRGQSFIFYFQNLSNKILVASNETHQDKKFLQTFTFFLYFFNSFFILVICYSVEKKFFDCFAESLIRGRFGFLQTDKVDYFSVIEYLHLKGVVLLQIYQE